MHTATDAATDAAVLAGQRRRTASLSERIWMHCVPADRRIRSQPAYQRTLWRICDAAAQAQLKAWRQLPRDTRRAATELGRHRGVLHSPIVPLLYRSVDVRSTGLRSNDRDATDLINPSFYMGSVIDVGMYLCHFRGGTRTPAYACPWWQSRMRHQCTADERVMMMQAEQLCQLEKGQDDGQAVTRRDTTCIGRQANIAVCGGQRKSASRR